MVSPMRPRVSTVWLAAAFGLTVWSCAPSPGVTPSTTTAPTTTSTVAAGAEAERRGGQAVVGIGDYGAPRTLNPFLDGPDTAVLDLLAPSLFATGYDIDPATMDAIPDVLAQIPSIANGGLVAHGDGTMDVTVQVSPAAEWADGTPISAGDLAFTIETVMDPDLPIRRDLRARYQKIIPGSVRASGAVLTFMMDTDASVEMLFDIILPAHIVGGSDFVADWNETAWVSGGPFEIGSYQPGQYLDLVRNENYWKVDPATGDRLPYLDRLVVRFFEAGDNVDPRLLRAFQSRDLDVVLLSFPRAVLEDYSELESQGAEVLAAPGLSWEHINFQFGPSNRNPDSLNQYLRFRKVVAYSIDRTALATERGTFPLSSVLRVYRPGLTTDAWAEYEHDIDEANGFLFTLGEEIDEDLFAGDGPRMVITTSSESSATVATAGQIVVMLNEAGVAAELQLEDPSLFFGRTLDNGTWDVAAWRLTATAGRSGAIAFIEMFDPGGLPFVGNNFLRWGTVDSVVENSPTIRYAEIVDALRETVDPAEIDRLLAEAERILASELVILPLITHQAAGAVVWGDEITGVTANPAQSELWAVETWRRSDD